MPQHVVMIGAGQAALACAAKLVSIEPKIRITILGAEAAPPYQRPPLSKKYLLGTLERARLFLRPEAWYAEHGIDLRLGHKVERIDPANKQVWTKEGAIGYDKLVIATGSRPRLLPDAMTKEAGGIYTIRTLADIDHVRGEFQEGRRLVVLGGGYIGLEAASVARGLGLSVTILEAAPRILARVAAKETSDFIRTLHESHGVEVLENVKLAEILTDSETNRIKSVRLEDQREIKADFMIVGIGALACDSLANAAALGCDQGILVDSFSQTTDPDIYAAGDCARLSYQGALLRLESVQNAIDQGENVALNILGQAVAYTPLPWFWSDQYDLTLQIAGLGAGYDRIVVRPGANPQSRAHWYYRDSHVIAVDALSDPRAYMLAKRLLAAGKSIPPEVVEDPSADLKTYL